MQRGSITIHHDGSWSLLMHGECDENIIEAARELIGAIQYAAEEALSEGQSATDRKEDDQ